MNHEDLLSNSSPSASAKHGTSLPPQQHIDVAAVAMATQQSHAQLPTNNAPATKSVAKSADLTCSIPGISTSSSAHIGLPPAISADMTASSSSIASSLSAASSHNRTGASSDVHMSLDGAAASATNHSQPANRKKAEPAKGPKSQQQSQSHRPKHLDGKSVLNTC